MSVDKNDRKKRELIRSSRIYKGIAWVFIVLALFAVIGSIRRNVFNDPVRIEGLEGPYAEILVALFLGAFGALLLLYAKKLKHDARTGTGNGFGTLPAYSENTLALLACFDRYDPPQWGDPLQALMKSKEGKSAMLRLMATAENRNRRGHMVEALKEELQSGSARNKYAVGVIVKDAIKLGHKNIPIIDLLNLLHLAGDPRAVEIGRLAEKGKGQEMERLIHSL